MTDETEQLAAISDLGLEAENFVQSRIGIYLIQRAEQEAEEANIELARHDPEDAKGIRALQNRIYRADSVRQWLAEAIIEGRQAAQIMNQPEE